MLKLHYIGPLPQEKVKTYVLCTYLRKSDIRNAEHYYIRPALETYEEIVKNKGAVKLYGCCFDFSNDEEVTKEEILMQCAIEGIAVDFELVENSDCENERFRDLRTGKDIWKLDLKTGKGIYAS